jgi:hypothetical protein
MMSSEVNAIQLAPNLRSWVLFPGKSEDETVYLVGSRDVDKYLTVPAQRYPLVMQIFNQLRDGYPPQAIEEELATKGMAVNVSEFCRMLAHKELIEWKAPEITTDGANTKTSRFGALFGQLKALSWQLFSLNLERFKSLLTAIATPALYLLVATAILSSVIVALQGGVSRSALRAISQEVLQSQGLLWMTLLNLLVLPFFVLLHESAHAVAAARGDIYPRRLSMRLYLLVAPYFSLHLPGLYTLPVGKRLLAIAAGPLMDLTLGNLSLLATRAIGGAWTPWLALLALSNYSRFIFNLMPILPMTDGYAFLSQAIFREIDIRGHATKEFRRWQQRKSNRFRGKYVVFFLFNLIVASVIIVGALLQVNTLLTKWLRSMGILPSGPLAWQSIGLIIALDALCLYLARKRLRLLLGW